MSNRTVDIALVQRAFTVAGRYGRCSQTAQLIKFATIQGLRLRVLAHDPNGAAVLGALMAVYVQLSLIEWGRIHCAAFDPQTERRITRVTKHVRRLLWHDVVQSEPRTKFIRQRARCARRKLHKPGKRGFVERVLAAWRGRPR